MWDLNVHKLSKFTSQLAELLLLKVLKGQTIVLLIPPYKFTKFKNSFLPPMGTVLDHSVNSMSRSKYLHLNTVYCVHASSKSCGSEENKSLSHTIRIHGDKEKRPKKSENDTKFV